MPPRRRRVNLAMTAAKKVVLSESSDVDSTPMKTVDLSEAQNISPGTSQQDVVTEAAPHDIEVIANEEETIGSQMKKKKREPLNLTEEQEQDVADWYRDHEILYNRRLKDYKDSKAKMFLFEKKSASMDPICTGDQLKVWIDSMRTLVGKITNRKSGDKARPRTEREDWVIQQFGFLEDHIKRHGCTRRKGGQLEKNLFQSSKTTSDTDEDNTSDGEEEEEKTEESDASTINTEKRFKKPKKTDRSHKSTKSSTASSIEELLGRADKVHQHLQERIKSQPTDSLSQAKRHFVEMIYHEIMQMDEMAWMDYQTQTFQMLMQFKQSRLQRGHQQQLFNSPLPQMFTPLPQYPQTFSHPTAQTFPHQSQPTTTHQTIDTQHNDAGPSTSSIISQAWQHTMNQ